MLAFLYCGEVEKTIVSADQRYYFTFSTIATVQQKRIFLNNKTVINTFCAQTNFLQPYTAVAQGPG